MQIVPTHAGLLAHSQRLSQAAQLLAVEQPQIQIQQVTQSEQESEPEPTAEWLQLAQQAQQEQRWMSAQGLYQQILNERPNHQAAQRGLQQIAEHFYQQAQATTANQAVQQQAILQGLQAVPNHQGLLALREKLRQSTTERPVLPTDSVIFTPSF